MLSQKRIKLKTRVRFITVAHKTPITPCEYCVLNARKSHKAEDALIPKTISPILSNTNTCPKSHSIQPPTPRNITKVLRDIHAENCFDTDVVGDIFSDTGISSSELMDAE